MRLLFVLLLFCSSSCSKRQVVNHYNELGKDYEDKDLTQDPDSDPISTSHSNQVGCEFVSNNGGESLPIQERRPGQVEADGRCAQWQELVWPADRNRHSKRFPQAFYGGAASDTSLRIRIKESLSSGNQNSYIREGSCNIFHTEDYESFSVNITAYFWEEEDPDPVVGTTWTGPELQDFFNGLGRKKCDRLPTKFYISGG